MLLSHTFNTRNAYVLIRYSFIQSINGTYLYMFKRWEKTWTHLTEISRFSSIERMRLSCVLTNLNFLNQKLVHPPNSQWRLSITNFVQQFFLFPNLRKLDDHPFFWV